MTIQELAKKSGLSTATISRALNLETRGKVAPSTRIKVEKLAERFGYVPNRAARSLRTSRFKTVGFAIPHVSGAFGLDYFSKMLAGISDHLLDSDYRLRIIMIRPGYVETVRGTFGRAEEIDGLILSPFWPSISKKYMEDLGVPCIAINEPQEGVRAHFVAGDHVSGGRQAAECLLRAGHRNALIVSGPSTSVDIRLRTQGFRAAFCAGGKRNKVIERSVGYEALEIARIVTPAFIRSNRLTSIFCFNDYAALQTVNALKAAGLRCPQDVSVVGYDNERRGEHADPGITTVDVPVYEMAKRAAERLLEFLQNPDKKDFYGRKELFPVRLIERGSVARAA